MNVSHVFSAEIIDEPPAEKVEVINSLLRSHNLSANPDWWAKLDDPKHKSKPLHVVVHNGANEVVGGLLAETSMSWLKIEIMAVREDHRRQGLGTLMLEAAEREARRRGCKYGFTDTMDYQAPEFYQRNGYKVAGTIPDWDSHDHTKFYFTKQLET